MSPLVFKSGSVVVLSLGSNIVQNLRKFGDFYNPVCNVQFVLFLIKVNFPSWEYIILENIFLFFDY